MLAFSSMSSLTFGLVLALCLHSALCQERSLSRLQRQAVTSELATGLTGTGTSFNSLYNDPYTQQNVLNQPYDELSGYVGGRTGKYPGATGYGLNGYGATGATGAYDPITGTYGATGVAGIGSGLATGGAYGGLYGGLNGATTGAWNGFGLGKGYGGYNRGRYPATGGVKY